MAIPPLGAGRPFLGNEHSPQEDLKIQAKMLMQIQEQMGQNPRNDEMLFKLREEFQDTLARMDRHVRDLPASQQKVVSAHLAQLKIQLNSYFYELQKADSVDQIQQTGAAMAATTTNLLNDLGFITGKPPLK